MAGTSLNGFLSIQGRQVLIGSSNTVGPISVPFASATKIVALGATSNAAIGVPTTSQMCVISNSATGVTLELGLVSAQLGYISPTYPTILQFDPNNYPSNIYITASTGAVVEVAFY